MDPSSRPTIDIQEFPRHSRYEQQGEPQPVEHMTPTRHLPPSPTRPMVTEPEPIAYTGMRRRTTEHTAALPRMSRTMSLTSMEKYKLDERRDTSSSNGGLRGTPGEPTRKRPLDWIIPMDKPTGPSTVADRLGPTIKAAREEESKYKKRGQHLGWALNVALGLQVAINALITGLAAVTTGRHTQVMTSVLGGIGTVVSSYLAKARGSSELETSLSRADNLQTFARQCESFVLDHGNEIDGHEETIKYYRQYFEELLGTGTGERKMGPTSTQSQPPQLPPSHTDPQKPLPAKPAV
ncbi:hypothetical protein BD410DRAFT_751440 [Rickenella mellea]|uniref:SMODS and SLOG-associating 2TM effector domain-containing protein n=1 Tax=Rickenella mellea TaxID=50990 RepID=A0A4Y7PXA4_9AGAM|nr:hypothetical protein BD410DRAFT_751440 [Rickenella mellea]